MDLNPDKIMPLPGIRESACLVRFSSIRHTSARLVPPIKGFRIFSRIALHAHIPIQSKLAEGGAGLFEFLFGNTTFGGGFKSDF